MRGDMKISTQKARLNRSTQRAQRKNLIGSLRISAAFCSILVLLATTMASAQGTAFTYQGQLKSGTTPANANYDFEFALHSAPTGSTQVGSTVSTNNVPLSNGVFTVTLDFGAA